MRLCYETLSSSITETKLTQWELANGTRCVLAPMPDAPLTCIDFWCSAGSANENPGEEGLAHFLEHMVFKGSNCLRSGEFDQKIEALGGSSNAATGFDDVHFYVLVPSTTAKSAIDLLLNLVLKPSLIPSEFCTERNVVLEEIAQYQDQPEEQVLEKFLNLCWEGHPYGRAILGSQETLKTMTPETMKSFHSRRYRGPNCCLSIAGSIPNDIKNHLCNSILANSNNQNEFQSEINPELIFHKRRKEIYIPRLESARLLIGWPIAPASNQEVIMGADLATSLLAEGRSSRLVRQLREQLQLVESIDMDITSLEQGSLIILEVCCSEENVYKAEKEIHNIIDSCVSGPLEPQEITRATRLVQNGLSFSLEASSHVAAIAGAQTLWNRQQNLLAPLEYIPLWDAKRLQEEIFPLLNKNLCCTLIAKPGEFKV